MQPHLPHNSISAMQVLAPHAHAHAHVHPRRITTSSRHHRCISCAAVPDEPSVSDALSKTTAVFQLAKGEAPSAAKQRVALSRDLSEAIAREDYASAASLRDALQALEAADPVARLRAELQRAVQEERFEEAATLRDELKDALQATTNLADIPVSSDTVTNNIRVRVKSFYVPQQSSPARGLYFFAYSITITNEGEDTVMLRNRHWLITDEDGQTEDVRCGCLYDVVPVSFQPSARCCTCLCHCMSATTSTTSGVRGWSACSPSFPRGSRSSTPLPAHCARPWAACRGSMSLRCSTATGSGATFLRWKSVDLGSMWSTSSAPWGGVAQLK